MSFNFKRLFSLAMVGMLVAFAPFLAGCGGASSTSGSSSGTGSGSGSTGTVSVSGTVDVLQKHLAELGISGVSLQSLDDKHKNMKAMSINFHAADESKVSFEVLGTGTDLGSSKAATQNSDGSVPFSSNLSTTGTVGVLKATYELTKGDKTLEMQSLGFVEDGKVTDLKVNEASTGTIIALFENEEVSNAIKALAAVDPTTTQALVKATATVMSKSLPALQNSSLVRDSNTKLDSVTGLPAAAAEEVANTASGDSEIKAAKDSATSAGAVAQINKSGTEGSNARLHLAKIFLGFAGGGMPADALVDLAKTLAARTDTKTIGELISGAAVAKDKTKPSTLTEAAAIANINEKVTQMTAELAKVNAGTSTLKTSSISLQSLRKHEGEGQGQGPELKDMIPVSQYMSSVTTSTGGKVTAETKFDVFTFPAMLSMLNESTLGNNTVDVFASLKALGIEFEGMDLSKGFVGIGMHPEFVSAGSGFADTKSEAFLYVDVVIGSGYESAVSAKVKFVGGLSNATYPLVKVDLSKISSQGKPLPHALFVGSPKGRLDQHWEQEFGSAAIDALGTMTSMLIPITGNIATSGDVEIEVELFDSASTPVSLGTFKRKFNFGQGIVAGTQQDGNSGTALAVEMVVVTPTPADPSKNTEPTFIASGLPVQVIATSTIKNASKLPEIASGKTATEKDIRYTIRMDRANFDSPQSGPQNGDQQQGDQQQGDQQQGQQQQGQQQQGDQQQGQQQQGDQQQQQQGQQPQSIGLHETTPPTPGQNKLAFSGGAESPELRKPEYSFASTDLLETSTDKGGMYFINIEAFVRHSDGYKIPIGNIGTPIFYGDKDTLFGDSANSAFKSFLGDTAFESAKTNSSATAPDVNVYFHLKNRVSKLDGATLIAMVGKGSFSNGVLTVTKAGSATIDATTGKATITIASADVSNISGGQLQIFVFVDRDGDGEWDASDPAKIPDIDKDEVRIDNPTLGHPEYHGGAKIVMSKNGARTDITEVAPYTVDMNDLVNLGGTGAVKTQAH